MNFGTIIFNELLASGVKKVKKTIFNNVNLI